MKFIVQPCGETMHVPAETAFTDTPSVPTYGGDVPMQLGSSVAAGTSMPRGPAATICASSCDVSQSGLGRSSVVGSLDDPVSAFATAPASPASRNAATSPAAASNLRMNHPP